MFRKHTCTKKTCQTVGIVREGFTKGISTLGVWQAVSQVAIPELSAWSRTCQQPLLCALSRLMWVTTSLEMQLSHHCWGHDSRQRPEWHHVIMFDGLMAFLFLFLFLRKDINTPSIHIGLYIPYIPNTLELTGLVTKTRYTGVRKRRLCGKCIHMGFGVLNEQFGYISNVLEFLGNWTMEMFS